MAYRNKTSGSKRAVRVRDVTLQASVVKTATFKSAGVELGDQSTARLTLVISAISGGNHSTVVKLQTSIDDVDGDYVDVPNGAFAAQTATTTGARLVVSGLDRWVRVVQTLDGTTVTYAVTAETC